MTDRQEWKRMAVGAAMVLVLGAVPALAEDGHSVSRVSPGGSPEMIQSYAGALGNRVGNYSGKLVCLRCDLAPGPKHTEGCKKEGHRHVLSMEGGAMVHPLLAGTKEALEEINSSALHGKEVTVHGNYYPSTGMIFADRVTAK